MGEEIKTAACATEFSKDFLRIIESLLIDIECTLPIGQSVLPIRNISFAGYEFSFPPLMIA